MITSIIIALFGFFSLLWVKKTKNNFTKLVNTMLGISAMAMAIRYYGISDYAPFAITFFSFLASFEATNSFAMQRQQIVFFVLSGFLFGLLSIVLVYPLPFSFVSWPFVLLFFGLFAYHWSSHKKKIRSRLGILIAWIGLGLAELIIEVSAMF